ncbi:hypothetical protein ACFE04_013473 [Oxalis oulophora]
MVIPGDPKHDIFPFELSASCPRRRRRRPRTLDLLKIYQANSSSYCAPAENPKTPREEVSTTLSLYDSTWIANNKLLVESSARNYAASERSRLLKEEIELQQRERAKEIFTSRVQQEFVRRKDSTDLTPLRMVNPEDPEYDNSPFELSASCPRRPRTLNLLKIIEANSSELSASCPRRPRTLNLLKIVEANSSELSASCPRRPRTLNLLKIVEANSSSCCVPAEKPLTPREGISTTLSLYDCTWIANNKLLVESSARNYAASGERSRFLKEEIQLRQRERAKEIFMSKVQQEVIRRNGDGPKNQEAPSTDLLLYDQSWIANNRALANASFHIYSVLKNKRKRSTQEIEEELKQTEVMARISAMKNYTQKDEEEEKKLGLSTKLVLYPDLFKITKTLTRKDINDCCRLSIEEKLIQNHVFPMWSVEDINKASSKAGVKVDVWDQDTNSQHRLVLKFRGNWKDYVFTKRWRSDFVFRRGLNVGNKIGLYWDQINKRFTFIVLQQAAAI